MANFFSFRVFSSTFLGPSPRIRGWMIEIFLFFANFSPVNDSFFCVFPVVVWAKCREKCSTSLLLLLNNTLDFLLYFLLLSLCTACATTEEKENEEMNRLGSARTDKYPLGKKPGEIPRFWIELLSPTFSLLLFLLFPILCTCIIISIRSSIVVLFKDDRNKREKVKKKIIVLQWEALTERKRKLLTYIMLSLPFSAPLQ